VQALKKTSTPYLDASGRPQLRDSIVAFLDLLGFSEASTASAPLADSQHLLDKIVVAIEDSRQFVRESFPDSEIARAGSWEIKFFSDNLSLGHPIDEKIADAQTTAWFIIRCAQQYQLRMVLNGYFLRGGITKGPVCLTEDIIFGSALIESYKLESKASIVPRVILSEPLRDLLLPSCSTAADSLSPDCRDAVCRDVDGWWFLNYLDAARDGAAINWEFVAKHKESVLKSLSSTTRHDVLPKFGWACRYHNVFCHWHRDAAGYDDRYRIARVDEQSTIYRLADEET
jgi:hypothetical protein